MKNIDQLRLYIPPDNSVYVSVTIPTELFSKLVAIAEAAKKFTEVEQLEPWVEETEDAFTSLVHALDDLEPE